MEDNFLNFVPEVMMLQPVVRDGCPVSYDLSDSEENKNTDIEQNVDDEKNQWVVQNRHWRQIDFFFESDLFSVLEQKEK